MSSESLRDSMSPLLPADDPQSDGRLVLNSSSADFKSTTQPQPTPTPLTSSDSNSGPIRRVVLFAKARPPAEVVADVVTLEEDPKESETDALLSRFDGDGRRLTFSSSDSEPEPESGMVAAVSRVDSKLNIHTQKRSKKKSRSSSSSTSPKYFFTRLCRVIPLLRPCSFASILLLLCLVLAAFAYTWGVYLRTQTQTDLFLLFNLPLDDPSTWTRIFRCLVRFGLLVVICIVFQGVLQAGSGGSGSSGVESGAGALVGILGWVWRRELTRSLLDKLFLEKKEGRKGVSRVCYLLMCRSGGRDDGEKEGENGGGDVIDNVDQRIESDARGWVVNASSVWVGLVAAVVQICLNTGILCWNGFYWLLIPTLIFPVINAVVYGLLITPLSSTIFQKDKLEGDFRFVHARVREFAESIAFFSNRSEDGDVVSESVVEKTEAEETFSKLVKTLLCLAARFGVLNFWTRLSLYVPNALFLVALMLMVFLNVPPLRSGMSPAEVSKIALLGYSIAMSTSASITQLFSLSSRLSVVMGDTARIGQMLERIDEIEEMDSDRDDRIRSEREEEEGGEDEKYIEMENVDVSTPNGNLLLRNVSFRLSDPRSHCLLIQGPSGCGKSSLCRLLAQLWDPSAGRVTKRNLSKIPDDIFFLPQRPYLVRGTLKDNVAYPLTKEESLCSDAALEAAMELANIQYLLKRASLHTENVFWDEKLSIGEQQRLALARVFFHRPQWVILDESTSALDPRNEEDLYGRLRELGIGIISVAHRRALLRFHDLVLTIRGSVSPNDGSSQNVDYDWTLQKISADMIPRYDNEWETISEYHVPDEEIDEFEMKHRGLEIETSNTEVGLTGINATLFKRLAKLFCSTRMMIRPCSMWVFIDFVIIVSVLSAVSPLPLVVAAGRILDAVSARQLSSTLTYIVIYVGSSLAIAVSFVLATYFYSILGICFRRNLTKFLHERYFRNRNFYKLNILDKEIDNPDQRICNDVDALTSGFNVNQGLSYSINHILTGFVALVAILIMSSIFCGWYSPVLALALFLVGGIAEVLIIVFLAKRTFLQQKFEGYFRISLARIKEYGEQIAFYGGLAREREVVQEKFDRLMRNSAIQTFIVVLQSFLVLFLFALSALAAHVGVALAVYFDQKKYRMLPTLVGLIQNNAQYLENATAAFLGILATGSLVGQLVGTTARVVQFAEKLDILEVEKPLDNRRDALDTIRVNDLTVQTPLRRKLFYNLSFQISKNDRLLVVGPSGCGKSSLLRVLCGLWPTRGCGSVAAPQHIGESGLFLLPQRPYLTLGSLKHQIIYPDKESKVPDEHLLQILVDVNLAYVYERLCSWEVTQDWGNILSPGEQQRVGMARLIYHKPMFAILDESTSALDEDNERLMYATCEEYSIAVVSVGHRRTLADFHGLRLAFDGSRGWVFSKKLSKKEDFFEDF